jgi:hypothetical protein
VRAAGMVVRIGIMRMVGSMVRVGLVVAQRHAKARRSSCCSLDRNGKRQREGNQDACES